MRNEFVHKSVVNTGFLWYARELEAERAKSGQLRKELGMVDKRGHTTTGAPGRGSSAAEPSTSSSAGTCTNTGAPGRGSSEPSTSSGAGTCSSASIPVAGHDPDPVRNLDAEGALDEDVMETKEQAAVPPARKTTAWYAARAEALHGVKRVAAGMGGMKHFGSYIVDKLKEGITKKSGAHSTSKIFGPEIVQQIIADPEMRKVFTKAIDADRKPPVSRFRFAGAVGAVSQKGKDLLRFAMFKTCPGHTTQQKDSDTYFKHLGEMWIPNGAQYDSATTLSPEEQEKSALDDIAEERAADEVADRELDKKVAEALCRPDDDFEQFARQAIAMLSTEFPKLSKEQLVQKFSSADHFATSTGGTQVFFNCRVVHVRAMLAGVLLGFIKALITEHEIFTEYVLIPMSEHSQGLVPHLYDALIHPHQHIKMLRVQVIEQNRMEIAAYVGQPREAWNQRLRELCTAKETGKKKKKEKKKMQDQPPLGGMHLHTWVTPTKKGKIWGPLDVPEQGAMLLADTVTNVLKAVEKLTNRTPLVQPIEVIIDGLDEKAVTEDVPDGTAFMDSRERDSDSEEPEEQLQNVTGRGHWGASSLINVLTMLLTGPRSPYMLAHNISYVALYHMPHSLVGLVRSSLDWRGCDARLEQPVLLVQVDM